MKDLMGLRVQPLVAADINNHLLKNTVIKKMKNVRLPLKKEFQKYMAHNLNESKAWLEVGELM